MSEDSLLERVTAAANERQLSQNTLTAYRRARTTELQAENPEKFTQKQPKRRRFAARPSPACEMRPPPT